MPTRRAILYGFGALAALLFLVGVTAAGVSVSAWFVVTYARSEPAGEQGPAPEVAPSPDPPSVAPVGR